MAIYQDFQLEFNIHPIKKDLVLVQDDRAVVQAIRNLILTNHYEAPFQPDKGCNIRRQLFEPITAFSASDIRRWIEETIKNFEPRAQISRIAVIPRDEVNAYYIEIEVFLDISPEPLLVNFFLERLGV